MKKCQNIVELWCFCSELYPQEFACFQCIDVKFSSMEKLHQHLMEHHSKCLFRCSLCDDTFDSRISLQVKSASILSHLLWFFTLNTFLLQVHFAAQHSNKKSSYRCKRCNACFFTDLDFEKHIFKEHLQIIKQSSPSALVSPPFPHFGTQRKFSAGSLSPDVKLGQKRLQCMFCGKQCETEEHLQAHVYTHMKQFNCMYCDKVFHLSSLLEQHIKAYHMKELLGTSAASEISKGPFGFINSQNPLDLCSPSAQLESFGAAKSQKSYVFCGICKASFGNDLDLLKHKATHLLTLSTPRCTLCNAVFGSPSNLAAHMFEHKVQTYFSSTIFKSFASKTAFFSRQSTSETSARIAACRSLLNMSFSSISTNTFCRRVFRRNPSRSPRRNHPMRASDVKRRNTWNVSCVSSRWLLRPSCRPTPSFTATSTWPPGATGAASATRLSKPRPTCTARFAQIPETSQFSSTFATFFHKNFSIFYFHFPFFICWNNFFHIFWETCPI